MTTIMTIKVLCDLVFYFTNFDPFMSFKQLNNYISEMDWQFSFDNTIIVFKDLLCNPIQLLKNKKELFIKYLWY